MCVKMKTDREKVLSKILKASRLAAKSGTQEESNAARLTLKRLMEKYSISEKDVLNYRLSLAFDELIEEFKRYTLSNTENQMPVSVAILLKSVEKDMDVDGKADLMLKVVALTNGVGMFFAGSKTVGLFKELMAKILEKHELKNYCIT